MSATCSSIFRKDVVSDYTTDNDKVRLYHCDRKFPVMYLQMLKCFQFSTNTSEMMWLTQCFLVVTSLHKVSPENSCNTKSIFFGGVYVNTKLPIYSHKGSF